MKYEKYKLEENMNKIILEQHKNKYEDYIKQTKISELQYLKTVNSMNDYQIKYIKEMKEVYSKFQDNDEQMLSVVKTYILYYLELESQLFPELSKEVKSTKHSVDSVEVQSHIKNFVKNSKSEKKFVNSEIKFEPYTPIYEKSEKEKDEYLKQNDLNEGYIQSIKTWFNKQQINYNVSPSNNSSKEKNEKKIENNFYEEKILKKLDKLEIEWFINYMKLLTENNVFESVEFLDIEKLEKDDEIEFMVFTIKEEEKETDIEEINNLKKNIKLLTKEAINKLDKTESRLSFSMGLNQFRNEPQLNNFSFIIISMLIEKSLGYCFDITDNFDDSHIGRILMNMSQTYYKKENDENFYIQKHLKDNKIWRDKRFWESTFYGIEFINTRSIVN
jgi:hypothetical protein